MCTLLTCGFRPHAKDVGVHAQNNTYDASTATFSSLNLQGRFDFVILSRDEIVPSSHGWVDTHTFDDSPNWETAAVHLLSIDLIVHQL